MKISKTGLAVLICASCVEGQTRPEKTVGPFNGHTWRTETMRRSYLVGYDEGLRAGIIGGTPDLSNSAVNSILDRDEPIGVTYDEVARAINRFYNDPLND